MPMLVETILSVLSKLEALQSKSLNEIMSDETLQGFILWNLYVAIQGCIDLTFKVIARLKLESPKTYKEAFKILYKNKLVSEDIQKSLQEASKFRNILAHFYTGINFATAKEVIDENLIDMRKFISELDESLRKRGIDIYEL